MHFAFYDTLLAITDIEKMHVDIAFINKLFNEKNFKCIRTQVHKSYMSIIEFLFFFKFITGHFFNFVRFAIRTISKQIVLCLSNEYTV